MLSPPGPARRTGRAPTACENTSVIGRRAAAILVLLLPVLLAAGLGIGAGWAASQLIRVPKVEQLASYRPDIVTEIRGTDGSVVARFAIERRFLVTRAQIPDVLVKAVLAAEDARFYDHGGVDIIRIGGAALRDLATRSLEQGASTITQQLAKLVFLTPEKSFARKINEVFLTVEIEKRYSKDQILTMYLNQVYLGHGNYGVEAASRWYFNRPAKDLTLPQAALLAGLIQRPEAYSPIRNPSAAKARRDLVLRRMAGGEVHRRPGRHLRARGPAGPLPFRTRGDDRPLLLRGGPAVPREDLRRPGALPAGTPRRLDARPAPPGLGGGGAPSGPAKARTALRVPKAPESRRRRDRPREVPGPGVGGVGRAGRRAERRARRRPLGLAGPAPSCA